MSSFLPRDTKGRVRIVAWFALFFLLAIAIIVPAGLVLADQAGLGQQQRGAIVQLPFWVAASGAAVLWLYRRRKDRLSFAPITAAAACIAFAAIAVAVWHAPALWQSRSRDESKLVRCADGGTIRMSNDVEIRVRLLSRLSYTAPSAPAVAVSVVNRNKKQSRYARFANAAVVVDDRGRAYRCTNAAGEVPSKPLEPGGETGGELRFETVEPGWQWLRLQLPAGSFDARGVLQFELAGDTPAPAPKPD